MINLIQIVKKFLLREIHSTRNQKLWQHYLLSAAWDSIGNRLVHIRGRLLLRYGSFLSRDMELFTNYVTRKLMILDPPPPLRDVFCMPNTWRITGDRTSSHPFLRYVICERYLYTRKWAYVWYVEKRVRVKSTARSLMLCYPCVTPLASQHPAYSSVETKMHRNVPSVRAERGLLRTRYNRKPERKVQKEVCLLVNLL